MPAKNRVVRKVFAAPQHEIQFRISEVSRMLGISPSALRQWEAAGLTRPSRTPGGYRTFSFEQVELLKYIHHLRTGKGLNIEAVRHMLGTNNMLNRPSPAGKAKGDGYPIGRKLRQLRNDRRITLAQAASATGLSPSFLSCLERGQTYASVSTMQKLSVFYKSSVLSLFETKGPNAHPSITNLVRPHQRKKISNQPGVKIELLAVGKLAMEAHIFHLGPGTSSGGAYHHEGEEFIFMLSGTCDIWLDEMEHYRLRQGDCLYFDSMQTHRWNNPGPAEATLLWVNTPPTF